LYYPTHGYRSPYPDPFLYIPSVPFRIAKQVLGKLNPTKGLEREEEMWRDDVDARHNEWRREMWERHLARHGHNGVEEMGLLGRAITEGNTIGYITKDVSCVNHSFDSEAYRNNFHRGQGCKDAGEQADDTVHTMVPEHVDIPKFIASPNPNVTDDTLIDLVFANATTIELVSCESR
jgi:hypothetical protein